MSLIRSVCAALLCVSAMSGCGGSSSGVTVSGTVTLNGQPLSKGQVLLQVGNESELRIAGIDNGKFEFREVPAGPAKAAVRTSIMKGQMNANKMFAKKAGSNGPSEALVEVPIKYEDPKTAQLDVVIESGKSLELKLTK